MAWILSDNFFLQKAIAFFYTHLEMYGEFFKNFEYWRQNSHILLIHIVPIEIYVNFLQRTCAYFSNCLYLTHSYMNGSNIVNFNQRFIPYLSKDGIIMNCDGIVIVMSSARWHSTINVTWIHWWSWIVCDMVSFAVVTKSIVDIRADGACWMCCWRMSLSISRILISLYGGRRNPFSRGFTSTIFPGNAWK